MEVVDNLMLQIQAFDPCCISRLTKEAIEEQMLNNNGRRDHSLFIRLMSKYPEYELIVRPGQGSYRFDVVTKFYDVNCNTVSMVFGKYKTKKVLDHSYAPRVYKGPAKARKL